MNDGDISKEPGVTLKGLLTAKWGKLLIVTINTGCPIIWVGMYTYVKTN